MSEGGSADSARSCSERRRKEISPAISFVVNCATQEELDKLWEKLSEGGEAQECGWLKDKYGVSWQIVPTVLGELMSDPDPVRSQRVMKAMLQMKKLDMEGLKKAYAQRDSDTGGDRAKSA